MLKMKNFYGMMMVLLLAAGLIGCNGEEETEVVNPFPETIELAIERAEGAVTFNVPGITIAIVDAESGFTWTAGFGYADTLTERSVTADTQFSLASVSRAINAIAVMQLVEQGLIDLDNPITTYLPTFSMLPDPIRGGNYQNITVRMILNHTAGFAFNYDVDGEGHEFLERLSEQNLTFEGGTDITYSVIGTELLSYIIAAVSGYEHYFDGYWTHVWENIHSRLGMSDSYHLSLSEDMLLNFAMPYSGRTIQRTLEEMRWSVGPTASANDMALLMYAILNDARADTGQLLTQDSFLQMFDFNEDFTVVINGRRSVGLAFMHRIDSSGASFIGHSGAMGFHYAEMVFNLESGIGVFVATNSTAGEALTPHLAEVLLRSAIAEQSGN